jgi:hypothetical protein
MCPEICQWATVEPELENSTIVESRLPTPGLPAGTGSP